MLPLKFDFMKKSILALTLLFTSIGVFAQHNHQKCAFDHAEQQLLNSNPAMAQIMAETEQLIKEEIAKKGKVQAPLYTVPVVFHVIYNDYRDNISRLQIEDGLRVLNEDFRRQNADTVNTRSIFAGVAADVEVEFKLAKKDAFGNCTEGITRTQSALSIDARDNVKSLVSSTQWPNSRYLNIWVVNSIQASGGGSGTVLGYAYRPQSGGNSFTFDGIVIRHDELGTMGSSTSAGRTLTHEAGHYLGLLHPFSGGCNGGDGVSDTPPVNVQNFGCNSNSNSCSNDNPDLPDMIENYMDYADGSCMNMFTQGQTSIMRATLDNIFLRRNLRLSSNLTNTGITNTPACQPNALFTSDVRVICEGESVQFFDESEDGDPDTWQWSFPGSTTVTSSSKNPVVTYNTPGVHTVDLTVSNTAGSSSVSRQAYVYVKRDPPAFAPAWSESFEINIPDNISIIDQGDGATFIINTQAASQGNQSIKLGNFNTTIEGEIDEVISPALDLTQGTNLDLTFDYAFAAKTNTDGDKLEVMVSTDCGETWTIRRVYQGGQIRTAANASQEFTPTSSEWATQTISFSAYAGNSPVLIKFKFEADGGNNFYLDNINFGTQVSLDENQIFDDFRLFPNPAKSSAILEVREPNMTYLNLAVFDVSGKKLLTKQFNNLTGELKVDILSNSTLKQGVYNVIFETSKGQMSRKLIIQ